MSCLSFVQAVCSILDEVHACNIAHGDIKPDAFMWDGQCNQYVLTDFNLSCRADKRFAPNRFSGTVGWVYVDSPIYCGLDGDLIALESLCGWLVGIPICGNDSSDFQYIQRCVHYYVDECTLIEWKLKVHRFVTALLAKSVCTSLQAAWTAASVDPDTEAMENAPLPTSSKTTAQISINVGSRLLRGTSEGDFVAPLKETSW